MLRHLALFVYLAAVAAWLLYCAGHTFYIGRMPLPRSQAVTLGAVLALAASLLGAWTLLAVRVTARWLGWARTPSLLDRRPLQLALLGLLLLIVLLGLYGRYFEPRRLVVRELPLGQPTATPVRIAVISDLHIDAARPPWTELATVVNRTDPDLIVLLGDTLNRPAQLGTLHPMLAAMRARYGKLAIRGNWEAWYWQRLPLLQGTGFRWLDGERLTRTIHGINVHLIGLPYRDEGDGARAEQLVSAAPRPSWRLMLYHTPDLAPEVPSADLYLAGHTHGGQISLPLLGPLVTLSRYGRRFARGRSEIDHTVVYVNPGIGMEPIIPLRIGARPEVTLVLLGEPPS